MGDHKVPVCVKASIIVLALVIGSAITIAIGADYEGAWEPDSVMDPDPEVVCPSSSVCAEWDVGGANQGSCCIPPGSLGTGELGVCEGPLVQSCEGTY